jgi:hypothetical protein
MNTVQEGNVKLTIPFDAINRAMLPTASGKATKLGELARVSRGLFGGWGGRWTRKKSGGAL